MVEISDAGTGTIDDLVKEARQEADKEAGKKAEKPKATPRPRGKQSLKEPLCNMYTSIGATVFAFNQADGILILENAENMATTLDELGKTNPQVRKVLERMVTTSAVGAVISAHMPVVLGILGNHDLLPKLGKKSEDGSKNADQETSPVASSEGNSTGYMAPTGPLTPVIVGAG